MVILHKRCVCVEMSVCINSGFASGLELTPWRSPGNFSVSKHKSFLSEGGRGARSAGVVKLARWVVFGEM